MDMGHTQEEYQVMLASASPRWEELLTQTGLEPEIGLSQMEEGAREKKPDMVVMKLPKRKAEDAASGCPVGAMVVGVDTVVSMENEIPGKPGAPMRAYEMLEKIQGRTHQVYAGAAILLCQREDRCRGITFAERTNVHVYPIACREIKKYTRCDEPLDKAEVYGTQGRFAVYIKGIDGDYANVVGLSVGRLCQGTKRLLEDRRDD